MFFDFHPTKKPKILQRVSRIYFLTSTSTLLVKYTCNIHVKAQTAVGLSDYEWHSICQFLKSDYRSNQWNAQNGSESGNLKGVVRHVVRSTIFP